MLLPRRAPAAVQMQAGDADAGDDVRSEESPVMTERALRRVYARRAATCHVTGCSQELDIGPAGHRYCLRCASLLLLCACKFRQVLTCVVRCAALQTACA